MKLSLKRPARPQASQPPSAEVARLLGLLETGDEASRHQAAMVLLNDKDPVTARHLARLLRTTADPKAREACAWLLCSLGKGDPVVIDALLEAAEDPHELMSVRCQAIEAFGASPSARQQPRVLRALVGFLEHPAVELRFWACFALGALKHRPAIPALRQVAQEDERVNPGWWYVAEEALDAIDHIEAKETPERVPVLHRDERV
ncbi:HEAT repeat domain-containing protein [Corallococcus terminator]